MTDNFEVDMLGLENLADALETDFPGYRVEPGDNWVTFAAPEDGGPVSPTALMIPLTDGRLLEICDGVFTFWADYDAMLSEVKGA